MMNRFPRVRGDVPSTGWCPLVGGKFSPRARGCSPPTRRLGATDRVFPACAGMFPGNSDTCYAALGFPRVRGDVPNHRGGCLVALKFSPRARGCSQPFDFVHVAQVVFPACAGMFLPDHRPIIRSLRFPRVRGDVPRRKQPLMPAPKFSPRARGCSVLHFRHSV